MVGSRVDGERLAFLVSQKMNPSVICFSVNQLLKSGEMGSDSETKLEKADGYS